MTGAALALFLRRAGLSVTLLERDTVASGASGRNLGLVTSGLGEHYSRSIEFWGRKDAAAITRFNLANHALLASLIEEYEIGCGYSRAGSLAVAADEEEAAVLKDSARLMTEDGFRCEWLDEDALARAASAAGFPGALFNPGDGAIDSAALTRGLAQAATRLGARVLEHTPADALIRHGRGWEIRSGPDSMSARTVFLASNAWIPALCPEMGIQPVRGQCLELDATDLPLLPIGAFSSYGAEYWRGALFGGMRHLEGGAELGHRAEVTEPVQRGIEEFCRAHFPNLRDRRVKRRWAGIMGYTGDGLPLVGVSAEGLYVAGGYTGHGFGWALLAARWLARLAAEGVDEIPALCRIDRKIRPSPSLAEI
jgi:glycine/D-amino acid oxidase-like deaminating enzyme